MASLASRRMQLPLVFSERGAGLINFSVVPGKQKHITFTSLQGLSPSSVYETTQSCDFGLSSALQWQRRNESTWSREGVLTGCRFNTTEMWHEWTCGDEWLFSGGRRQNILKGAETVRKKKKTHSLQFILKTWFDLNMSTLLDTLCVIKKHEHGWE